MSKTYNYRTAGTLIVTTTGTINDLDVQGCGTILMNNATASTITGVKNAYPGQEITFISIGTGQVNFAHQNAGSSAINRLFNFATSGNTPLAAGSGRATYQYDDTTLRWQLVNHIQGTFISVAFSAGNFTASAGSWTLTSGDQAAYAFYLSGTLLYLLVTLNTTSVTATPIVLQVAIPNGFTAVNAQVFPVMRVLDNGGAATVGLAETLAGGAVLRVYKDLSAGANWSVSTDLTYVQGMPIFQVL